MLILHLLEPEMSENLRRLKSAVFAIILFAMVYSLLGASNGVSKTNLVGTWKIDPSSYTVRSLATPNSFPRPELPTKYNTFSLTLRQDGSFVVTNLPSEIFFGTPSKAQGSGRWYVRTQLVATVVINGTKLNRPDENDRTLQRIFEKSHGYWDFSDMPLFRSKESPFKLSAAVIAVRDRTGTYEWSFVIRKQD